MEKIKEIVPEDLDAHFWGFDDGSDITVLIRASNDDEILRTTVSKLVDDEIESYSWSSRDETDPEERKECIAYFKAMAKVMRREADKFDKAAKNLYRK